MKLATAASIPALIPAIKRHMHSARFMVIWCPHPGTDTVVLFASSKSEEDALLEAAEAHPLGALVQRIEYLSPERLAEMRTEHQKDPLSKTLEELGRL